MGNIVAIGTVAILKAIVIPNRARRLYLIDYYNFLGYLLVRGIYVKST